MKDLFYKILKSKSFYFYLILIGFITFTQGKSILDNFTNEGRVFIPKKSIVLNENKKIVNFPTNERSIAIFWATWCAPCKVEMARIKNSVLSGKIKGRQIFAINPFESKHIVTKFLKKNEYPFTFITAPKLSKGLNISRTPTIVFFDENKVERISSGLSLIGIYWAEYFLGKEF